MRIFFIICCLLLTACSSNNTDSKYTSGYGAENAPDVYTVKKGDTLFEISWRFGLNTNTILKNNNISNPDKIFAGQKLYFTKRSSSSTKKTTASTRTSSQKKSSSSAVVKGNGRWVWPIKGKVIKRFNPQQVGANGLRIAGSANQTVNASEAGTVVYKGNQLKGYENVIIIKHNNGVLSAYGFLSKTYVEKGQKIKKRQKIGTVGYGADKQLMLHFEVRKNGKPTNPLRYIGSRYHF